MARIELYKGKGKLAGHVFVEDKAGMLCICKEDELPTSVEGIGEMILNAVAMERYLDMDATVEVKH